MKYESLINSMLPVKVLFLNPSSLFWKVRILKMPFVWLFLWEEMPIQWVQLLEV